MLIDATPAVGVGGGPDLCLHQDHPRDVGATDVQVSLSRHAVALSTGGGGFLLRRPLVGVGIALPSPGGSVLRVVSGGVPTCTQQRREPAGLGQRQRADDDVHLQM